MHFKISKELLTKPLNRAVALASDKDIVPILKTVKIGAVGNKIMILGGDGEVYIKSIAEGAEVFKNGIACLPAKKFGEIISKMGAMIELEAKANKVIIKSGSSKAELSSDDHPMYPILPEISGIPVTVTGEAFKSAIKRTAFAASEKASTAVLEGILITAEFGLLTALACDRHRLSELTFSTVEGINTSAVVRAKTLLELEKMIVKHEDIELMFAGHYFAVNANDFTFYSKVLDGTYPNTKAMMNKSYTTAIRLEVEQFKLSLERALIIVKDVKTKIVTLYLSESGAVLKGDTEADMVTEEIECSFEGAELVVSFNAEYMIEALKALRTDHCRINFTGEMRPIFIYNDDDSLDLQLILPYRTK